MSGKADGTMLQTNESGKDASGAAGRPPSSLRYPPLLLWLEHVTQACVDPASVRETCMARFQHALAASRDAGIPPSHANEWALARTKLLLRLDEVTDGFVQPDAARDACLRRYEEALDTAAAAGIALPDALEWAAATLGSRRSTRRWLRQSFEARTREPALVLWVTGAFLLLTAALALLRCCAL